MRASRFHRTYSRQSTYISAGQYVPYKMKVWNLRDVQEAIIILVFFIDAAHQGGGRGQHLVHEDKDSFLGRKLDTLANHIDELTDCEICWNEVLLLVDSSNVRLLDLLADDL